jgi:hypothetical protein
MSDSDDDSARVLACNHTITRVGVTGDGRSDWSSQDTLSLVEVRLK